MSSQTPTPEPATASTTWVRPALRFLAFTLMLLGTFQGLANTIESIREFDPNYFGHFFASQWLRPLLLFLTGATLWPTSGFWARRIAASPHQSSQP